MTLGATAIVCMLASAPRQPQGSGASAAFDTVMWLGILIAIVVVAGFLVLRFRARLGAGSRPEADPFAGGIRGLRRQGLISEEEYRRAVQSIVDRAAAERDQRLGGGR